MNASLRPPPYASAVSNVVIPSSHARSMIRNASSSEIPCPKNSGAEPTPPKFPQPRMTRETAIPLRPSSRVSTKAILGQSLMGLVMGYQVGYTWRSAYSRPISTHELVARLDERVSARGRSRFIEDGVFAVALDTEERWQLIRLACSVRSSRSGARMGRRSRRRGWPSSARTDGSTRRARSTCRSCSTLRS